MSTLFFTVRFTVMPTLISTVLSTQILKVLSTVRFLERPSGLLHQTGKRGLKHFAQRVVQRIGQPLVRAEVLFLAGKDEPKLSQSFQCSTL